MNENENTPVWPLADVPPQGRELTDLERAVWLPMTTDDYSITAQDSTQADLIYVHNDPPHPVTHIEIRPPDDTTIRVRLTDTASLTAALHNAIAALNTNSFTKRSLALQDLAREVTRLLGLEWNPYGQTRHPDGTITSRDEDIRP